MFKVVALAGTFDRLHKGHRFFLAEAFRWGERVIIGLTSEKYLQKKILRKRKEKSQNFAGGRKIFFRPKVQSYKERREELKKFLEEKNFLHRAKIVKIDDLYGPAGKSREIEALVITSQTKKGGQLVNLRRRKNHLSPLKLLSVPLVLAEDGKRISSSRIYQGEIDREGRVFQLQLLKLRSPISEALRQRLKKPQGLLFPGHWENSKETEEKLKFWLKKWKPLLLITVGDEVTKFSFQIGLSPHLSIVDFRVQRKKVYHSLAELIFPGGKNQSRDNLERKEEKILPRYTLGVVRNPPGHITSSLVEKVNLALRRLRNSGCSQILKVLGEEDLAAVPAILLSPLDSLVLYGQPNEGLVAVFVTEEKKEELLAIVSYHC